MSVFHFIEKEQEWRRERGLPEGFESLKARKPLVAVGASEPLGDQLMMADYFREWAGEFEGRDIDQSPRWPRWPWGDPSDGERKKGTL